MRKKETPTDRRRRRRSGSCSYDPGPGTINHNTSSRRFLEVLLHTASSEILSREEAPATSTSAMYLAHPQHQGHVDRHHGIPPSMQLTRNIPPSSTHQNPPIGSSSIPQPMQQLPSQSHRMDGRIYSLEVNQQPIRARMCGFGDKVRTRRNTFHQP